MRESVLWQQVPDSGGDEPVTPLRDGAAEDIRAFDTAVDATRAKGLPAAQELLRADAARGASLDFGLLQRWQHVLSASQPPPFRGLPAFGKGGRERRGIGPATTANPPSAQSGACRHVTRSTESHQSPSPLATDNSCLADPLFSFGMASLTASGSSSQASWGPLVCQTSVTQIVTSSS